MNMRKRVRELEDAMISTCDVAQHVTRDVKNLSTSIGEWSVLSEVFFWLDLY